MLNSIHPMIAHLSILLSLAPQVLGARPADEPDLAAAVQKGISLVVDMQEPGWNDGDPKAQWPYEGVYRVGGQIPVGYRIGGTAISGRAILLAPAFAEHPERIAAVSEAVRFVVAGISQPLMSPDEFDGGYDVRGWGYTYGLHFLLEVKRAGRIPAGLENGVEDAIRFYLRAIAAIEIPQSGGWNYARQAGRTTPSPSSPFMTGPTLQALFEARAQGYEIDPGMIDRALNTLEAGRTATGSVVYSGPAGDQAEAAPGAVGRMLVTETTLNLAGRGDLARLRGAVDAFIAHWEWLNKRRAQKGTHVAPYGIAPYYFYYAHYYAAQAVEQLPERERAEYHRRIRDLLFSVQLENGAWNDRVFDRSANFGTSMGCMTIMMPDMPRPAVYEAKAADDGPAHTQPEAAPASN